MTLTQPNLKQLALFGSTGSIGTQTLDVVLAHKDKISIVALTAGQNITLLINQLKQLTHHQISLPSYICLQDDSTRKTFIAAAPAYKGTILCGAEGLLEIARLPQISTVVMGLSGGIGLPPSLAAVQAGKYLLTANKETFVTGGHLIQPYLPQIVPLDSEHSAIFQCLKGQTRHAVKNLWLTASGGPFRLLPMEQFKDITPQQALNHPNWVMGPKVTVDSATLMNKGLEVIEAHWLFGIPAKQIEVVVHPQSIIHSGVAFVDGSTLFQAGTPDMRVPIQVALAHPERWVMENLTSHLSFTDMTHWSFEPPDLNRFPCLQLAYTALAMGPHATAMLNAADEWAVEAFLQNKITFNEIPKVIEQVLQQAGQMPVTTTVQEVLSITNWVKQHCSTYYNQSIVSTTYSHSNN